MTMNASSGVPQPSRDFKRGYWIGLAAVVSIGAVIAGTEGVGALVAVLITVSVPAISGLMMFLGWRVLSRHPRVRAVFYEDVTVSPLTSGNRDRRDKLIS
ncbi:MAG: hypothetical protein ACLPVY_07375 [Acidimicrobiia bacterium]